MWSAFFKTWSDPLSRLAFLCVAFTGVAAASTAPYRSIIAVERIGLSTQELAFVMVAGGVSGMVASVLVGIYLDRSGNYRSTLILSNLVGILGGLAIFFLPAKFLFIFASVLVFPIAGASFSQYFALANLAATKNPELDKNFSLSLPRASFAALFALVPPVIAIAVALGMELLFVYVIAAAASLITLALVMFRWPADIGELGSSAPVSFKTAISELLHPSILLRVFLISTIIGINALFSTVLGLLIINDLGGTEADVGKFAGAIALVEVPTMLMVSRVLRIYSKSTVIFVGGLIYCAFVVIFAAMPSVDQAWLWVFPGGIGAGIILSVPIGYVQDLVAERAAAGSSLISVTTILGMLFAAGMLAIGTTLGGYTLTVWITAVIGAVACIWLFVADFRRSENELGHAQI